MSEPEFSFEPLGHEHFALLRRWRAAAHVAEWWGEVPSLQALAAEHARRNGDAEPGWCHLARRHGRPIGVIESYRWSSYPSEAREVGAAEDEAGIDYLIGDPSLVGRGVGPRMLDAFITQVVYADPSVRGVRTNVAVANRRSWRCLEKVGFERIGPRPIAGEEGPQYVLAHRRR